VSEIVESPRPLLATKLHPPAVRTQTVPRDRLFERLRPRPDVKLTMIAAPAGSGKTTLLGVWRELEERRRPIAWVTLDEGDNDPVVFWSYVIAALRSVCPELTARLPSEQVGPARTVDTIVLDLVNELSELNDIALVLDDFHRIASGPTRDTIGWFIDNAPSTFQLVIATRSEPGLPLAMLRAHGALLELRADDLGFTRAEADVLLNDRLGLSLARADVAELVERTEGWAAGLYLAALSLQGVEDRHTFVRTFGSRNRHVVDFLLDEVLDAHEPELQELMLRSSILEQISGPLCDFVLERDDSGELLERLSRTNLFLLPLDDGGEWYRFHHLFAQLLRVELEHREPDLVPVLHRRAFAWYLEHDVVAKAIEHALEAGAFAEASDAIAGAWLQTAGSGRHATVLAWLDAFPPGIVHDDPQLLLMRAWTCAQAGRRDETEAAVAALERGGWPGGRALPDGSSSLEASLATLRAGFPWGDVATAHVNALRAVDLQAPGSALRATAAWSLALACFYRGDHDEADEWLDAAIRDGERAGRWLVLVSGLAYRSLLAGERGDSDEQRAHADAAARIAREHGLEEVRGEVHVAVGAALEAEGRLEEALPHLERGTAVLRRGQPLDFALALLRLAEVLRATGRRKAAATALADARAAVDSCRDPGILAELLAGLEGSPQAVRSSQGNELSTRELMILRMLRGRLSERDIGRELYLSHNTIHSHTRSIYRKLGVSSRTDAVRQAKALGLLKDGGADDRTT
jgi:LuxR family transcriptional regulator, maltose regulon positive regulatory protein